MLRVLGANLADKNIILTGKGVIREKIGDFNFDLIPYECLHAQGVLPSSVKDGSDDYIKVYAPNGVSEYDLNHVYQLDDSIVAETLVYEDEEEEEVELDLYMLKPVEFSRNQGT